MSKFNLGLVLVLSHFSIILITLYSTAKDLAFREALLGKSPACILLLHTGVASFSNFLATFDQDLWQALILKRPFSVNDGTYNATTICSAVWIVMHVFQSSFNSTQ